MARRRTFLTVLAGLAALGVVIGVSIVWPGLDARQTPAVDSSVWALQTSDGRRYARVNTVVGELDTVRGVGNPSLIAEAASGTYLFSESFGKVTRLDEAMPVDLDDETLRQSESTPEGTVDVAVAGEFVAYRTDSGAVWVGRLSDAAPTKLDPYGTASDENAPQYSADAVAVDDAGILFSYSAVDGAVLRYDLTASDVLSRDELSVDVAAPAISAAGGDWVLLDGETRDVWRRGSDGPVNIADGTEGQFVLAQPSSEGDSVYVADERRLLRVPTDGSDVITENGGLQILGTPARPVSIDGIAYAAWLPQTGEGVLWNSQSGSSALDYGAGELGDQRRPTFTVGTGAAVLNETRSGWVWTIPDGDLVTTSQNWSLDQNLDPTSVDSEEEATVVLDPKPPVAVADSFGVRAGSLVTLPVLLNDHDPNEDVLSIDPTSVTGLDPGFGIVSITDNQQRLAVHVADGATGSATFQYRVTDGTSALGLYSEPVAVTLTVTADSQNSAPVWCATDGCLADWPVPGVAPGGTVSIPVLPGWVDPDGDPLLLLSVENLSSVGVVAASPAGDVVYQHSDDGSGQAQTVELAVTVADTRGATTTKPLVVQVSGEPGLTAQSFTMIDTLGGGVTVDVAPHVTGTAGRVSLTSVRVLDDAAATAVAASGGTAFDFAGRETGTYRVSFTVGDGVSEATGIARITLLADDAPAQLATAPVVGFVHPREDVTIDVFEAVSNPTRRVLLLSDVVPVVEPGATLSVDVVGQNYMRVSGTTSTGEPGRLGTVKYVVSDGTQDAGSRVEGEATIYLLPPAPELAPIAVDDTVVVRAGAQVDIPVLENDVAPSGSSLTLDPSRVMSSSEDALAFASGDALRYLASETPGTYTVEYAVFASGSPVLSDSAVVSITVMPDDANRSPLPETLEGRVLSGQSTSIPFSDFTVDPDGDAVSLDQIVSQPTTRNVTTPGAGAGSATLSADRQSIIYSSVAGFEGQVSFTYRVVDSFGATGTATARVGVLNGQSNPSPVTFTDYVQVQVGADSTLRVNPIANDVDPTGGSLRVTGIQPDVAESLEDGSTNAEFTRLNDLIQSVDGSTIVFTAGDTPGTLSYLYDVESDSGNTARGLVVVKVVRDTVPNYPIVTDTVLTAETRGQFRTGVDVVGGKVSWAGGDVSNLTLSLWGAPSGVSVSGSRISGTLPAQSRVIPFSLSGEGRSGPVTTYGFLRVPGQDDLTIALRSDTVEREVTEGESVTINIASMVTIPSGESLEIGSDVAASGARPEGRCVRVSGARVSYDAGFGAPWADACHVPVRLAGTSDWTYLNVPIRVLATEPQPQLRSGALTIAPGDSRTFDLRDLTTWQGTEDWANIVYAVQHVGTGFEVTQAGSVVTITGSDRALTAAEEIVTVTVTSHGGVDPARLILRVGAAPSTLPQGGTVVQMCSQASGTSCTIPVLGASGEVNPLPRTPLELSSVRATGACVGVSFATSGANVIASWTGDAPGATCTASFSVRDAQGRLTSGERDGAILLDLQGYPKSPASIVQSAYASGQVTLRIDPGESRQAYPALTGFVLRQGGAAVATCSVEGVCPVVRAPNGEERTYEAVAVNSVGESRGSVRTQAWAYDTPSAPSGISTSPLVTGGEGGLVSIRIASVDAEKTGYLEISSAVGEVVRVDISTSTTSVTVPSFRVGANTLTPVVITPYSRFPVPPGLNGSTSGAAVTIYANGIGAPTGLTLALSSASAGGGQSTITATTSASNGGDGGTLRLGIAREGDRCVPVEGGSTRSFSVPDGEVYTYVACAETWFDGRLYGRAGPVTGTVNAAQSTAAPTGYTFAVSPTPDLAGQTASWVVRDLPVSSERVPNRNVVEYSGVPSSVFGGDPNILVRYTHIDWRTSTEWARATPRAGSAPYQVSANWSLAACTGGLPLDLQSQSTDGAATVSFDRNGLVFTDADGNVLPFDPTTGIVPPTATLVTNINVSVDWSGTGWGLNPATSVFSGNCTPAPAEPAP